MSARIDAAARTLLLNCNKDMNAKEQATYILRSSDAELFSEAAIERAAKAMQAPWSSRPWDQLSEESKDVYRNDVRAVVAALREEA